MITIARDPKEFLTSSLCMDVFYKKANIFDDFSILIKVLTELYGKLEESEVIIKYEDLIYNPYGVAKYLSKTLNLNFTDKPFINKAKDQPEYGHLVSSSGEPEYGFILEKLNEYDLSEIYSIHARLLSKAVKIAGDL
jgi:hypothetical protein